MSDLIDRLLASGSHATMGGDCQHPLAEALPLHLLNGGNDWGK